MKIFLAMLVLSGLLLAGCLGGSNASPQPTAAPLVLPSVSPAAAPTATPAVSDFGAVASTAADSIDSAIDAAASAGNVTADDNLTLDSQAYDA